VASHLVGHLGRQPGACIVHGEDDAEDVEARVEDAADQAERVAELREPLEGVVLALDRDQHGVGGREAVHRQQPERGGAVEDHEIVLTGSRSESRPQAGLARQLPDQLDFGAGQVNSGGDDGQARGAGARAGIGERQTVAQAIVRGD
jgi:hypothetical protein